jgi:hypothetical protein
MLRRAVPSTLRPNSTHTTLQHIQRPDAGPRSPLTQEIIPNLRDGIVIEQRSKGTLANFRQSGFHFSPQILPQPTIKRKGEALLLVVNGSRATNSAEPFLHCWQDRPQLYYVSSFYVKSITTK